MSLLGMAAVFSVALPEHVRITQEVTTILNIF
jgi:hypothetical protein